MTVSILNVSRQFPTFIYKNLTEFQQSSTTATSLMLSNSVLNDKRCCLCQAFQIINPTKSLLRENRGSRNISRSGAKRCAMRRK